MLIHAMKGALVGALAAYGLRRDPQAGSMVGAGVAIILGVLFASDGDGDREVAVGKGGGGGGVGGF